MTGRLLRTACCCLLGAGLNGADVQGILEATAALYNRLGDYVLEVEFTREGHALGASGDGLRNPLNYVLLARSGKRVRYEAGQDRRKPGLIWFTDGVTTWRFSAERNRYTEAAAEAWPAVQGPGNDLPGLEWRYVRKFRTLPDMASRTKLILDGVPADKACAHPSVLLEIDITDNPDRAVERLRIDKETGLPCHSVLRVQRTGGGRASEYVTTTTYRLRPVDPAGDAHLFSFVPPKGARREN